MEAEVARAVKMSPNEVWRYRWDIALVRSGDGNGLLQGELRMTVDTVEELSEIILRYSYNPGVVAVHFERRIEFDVSHVPDACHNCGESYSVSSASRRWHECECGGHLLLGCTACGFDQYYPRIGQECVRERSPHVRRHRVSQLPAVC